MNTKSKGSSTTSTPISIKNRLIMTSHGYVDYRGRECPFCFKGETGISPGKYVIAVRLQKASEFLEKTSLSIVRIRERVGMPDDGDFVRAFRKKYGMTPSEYRAKKKLR